MWLSYMWKEYCEIFKSYNESCMHLWPTGVAVVQPPYTSLKPLVCIPASSWPCTNGAHILVENNMWMDSGEYSPYPPVRHLWPKSLGLFSFVFLVLDSCLSSTFTETYSTGPTGGDHKWFHLSWFICFLPWTSIIFIVILMWMHSLPTVCSCLCMSLC